MRRRSSENEGNESAGDQVVNPTDDSTDEIISKALQSMPEDERNKAGAKIMRKLFANEEVKQETVNQLRTDRAFRTCLRDILNQLDDEDE